MCFDPAACYADAYAATISHFIDALASGAPFQTGPLDNLNTVRLAEDVYRHAGSVVHGDAQRLPVATGASLLPD